MFAYDGHGLPYFIGSSGDMQFREVCYTVVSYAPYTIFQSYTTIQLATFWVTIFDFCFNGAQPKLFGLINRKKDYAEILVRSSNGGDVTVCLLKVWLLAETGGMSYSATGFLHGGQL